MQDTEIIKALEPFKSYFLRRKTADADWITTIGDVLDLINRQKAEIEELTYKLECLLCHATGGKLSKSTYTLKTMECVVTDYINDCCYETESETKAEAIKEFAERLKKKYEKDFGCDWHSVYDPIDNLVKEMDGEDNA